LTQELVTELSDSSVVRVFPYDRLLQIIRRFRVAGEDVSSRDALQAISGSTRAQQIIVPTLLYENGSWRARLEFRQPTTAINVATVETASVTSSLVKDTAYGLVPALAEKVKVLAFTEDGKNGLLAGTDTGLYRSYDVTKGWEKLSLGDGVSQNIFAIHTSPQRPEQIWVGTETSSVLVSNDDGKTWTKTNASPEGIPVSSLAVDPKRPDHVYVGNGQALYYSRDGGQTWTRGRGLPLGNYTSILIDPNNTDEVFISSALESDGGIYYSDNAGSKWKRVDSKDMKLPSRRIWTMAFDPTDPSRIFAASHASGIYRIDRRVDTAKENTTRPRIATNGN